tara:strand:+ start:2905 stop:3468 length:564 start_codon:yes stop_codon:yes gene_type:complete
LIDEYVTDEEPVSFLSLDEVISGNSLTRVYKAFDAAKNQYANRKTVSAFGTATDFRTSSVRSFRDSIKEGVNYQTIGIVDQSKAKRVANRSYQGLLIRGTVIPVDTQCIVTMDRSEFFPAKYKVDKDSEGRQVFLPVVDSFEVHKTYIDFLATISGLVGKDPAKVTVQNMAKIRSSYQRVPEALRSV